MTVENAKKMRFTLRYPPDKILDTFSGSFSATKSNSPPSTSYRTNNSFSHNLGLQPLLQMVYSRDGGTTWNDQHVTEPDLTDPDKPVFQTIDVGCYATTTAIVIVATNWTNTTETIDYRVVAFV